MMHGCHLEHNKPHFLILYLLCVVLYVVIYITTVLLLLLLFVYEDSLLLHNCTLLTINIIIVRIVVKIGVPEGWEAV